MGWERQHRQSVNIGLPTTFCLLLCINKKLWELLDETNFAGDLHITNESVCWMSINCIQYTVCNPLLLIHPELSLITLHWFLTSFASVVDIRLLLRIWDLLFYQGSLVLFQVTLGMLKIKVFAWRYLFWESWLSDTVCLVQRCLRVILLLQLMLTDIMYYYCCYAY